MFWPGAGDARIALVRLVYRDLVTVLADDTVTHLVQCVATLEAAKF
jgi:hypothetical protein